MNPASLPPLADSAVRVSRNLIKRSMHFGVTLNTPAVTWPSPPPYLCAVGNGFATMWGPEGFNMNGYLFWAGDSNNWSAAGRISIATLSRDVFMSSCSHSASQFALLTTAGASVVFSEDLGSYKLNLCFAWLNCLLCESYYLIKLHVVAFFYHDLPRLWVSLHLIFVLVPLNPQKNTLNSLSLLFCRSSE